MKTTLEISTPLLRRAKRLAAREGTTLRALVEQALSSAIQARQKASPVIPPLVTFKGNGLTPEFAEGGWEKIRDAIYEGRGT